MFKITWSQVSDPHSKFFAICDYHSVVSLYWNLLKGGSNDGCKACNVKVWDLSDNEVEVNKFAQTQGEYSRP